MLTPSDIRAGAFVRGLIADQVVQVLSATPIGPDILEVVLRDGRGGLTERLLYPGDLDACEVLDRSAHAFDGDAARLRLVSEALRLRLAHLFDPYLAIHTSLVEPLPHQITAVYAEMLARQPLRFLLADDPGAGKTIMAGLLIKELMVRGELERCLIVAPGGLVEQWQDELALKFGLAFDLLSRDRVTASRVGDPFAESPLWLARMDMLSRDEDLQARLAGHDWDLIVVDQAHRMSATLFGREPKHTKRYLLGRAHLSVRQLLGYYAQYLYLDRLAGADVLLRAIREGVGAKEPYFGYADGVEGERYLNLKFGEAADVRADEHAVLVRAEAATRQRSREEPGGIAQLAQGATGPLLEGGPSPEPAPQPPALPRHVFAQGALDTARMVKRFNDIYDEVIQHLIETGANVRVEIVINADVPNGLAPHQQRTVLENGRSLGLQVRVERD